MNERVTDFLNDWTSVWWMNDEWFSELVTTYWMNEWMKVWQMIYRINKYMNDRLTNPLVAEP
jgi:hypothetical protein